MPWGRLRIRTAKRGLWSPHQIPRSLLYAYWDAAMPAPRVVSSAAAVSSWVDDISNINTAQGTGGLQPIVTSNGWIYGDSVGMCLGITPVPSAIPTGTNPVWDWIVVDQTTPASTTTLLTIGGWGTTSTATRRIVTRDVVSGVNRASLRNGSDVATNPNVDFSGKHVICSKSSGTAIQMVVDGIGMSQVASTSSIGTASYLRHFASAAATGTFPFPGGIAVRLITAPLSAALEARVLAYLQSRL